MTSAGYVLGEQYHDIDKIIGPLSNAIIVLLVIFYIYRLWTHRGIDPASGTVIKD